MFSTTLPLFAAALAAASAPGGPDRIAAAEGYATAVCKEGAKDPKNPWAMAHGVLAFGSGFKAADGRLAIDAMVEGAARRTGQGEAAVWDFPAFQGLAPVDPHSNHTVATLLRSGVPLTRAFKTSAGAVTLGELAASLERGFKYRPSPEFFREHAWTVDALAAVTKEKAPTFRNGAGETIDVAKVLDEAVAALAAEQRFLDEAQREGVAMVQKRKQGIWSHPCGGLHLAQAAFAWGDQKEFRKRHLAEAADAERVLLYRMTVETRAMEAALDQAPEYALPLNVQRLKFYGHWLETMKRLERLGWWKPSAERKKAIGQARERLADAALALKAMDVLPKLAQIRVESPQVYLDLVGDSCHAVGGFRVSK